MLVPLTPAGHLSHAESCSTRSALLRAPLRRLQRLLEQAIAAEERALGGEAALPQASSAALQAAERLYSQLRGAYKSAEQQLQRLLPEQQQQQQQR